MIADVLGKGCQRLLSDGYKAYESYVAARGDIIHGTNAGHMSEESSLRLVSIILKSAIKFSSISEHFLQLSRSIRVLKTSKNLLPEGLRVVLLSSSYFRISILCGLSGRCLNVVPWVRQLLILKSGNNSYVPFYFTQIFHCRIIT